MFMTDLSYGYAKCENLVIYNSGLLVLAQFPVVEAGDGQALANAAAGALQFCGFTEAV
jgi:hypothetical protein